MKFNMD